MSGQSWKEVLVEQQVDGPTITTTGTTPQTILAAHARYLLPAGYFNRIGKGLDIDAWGRISTVVTSPGTARFDVRLDSTVVFDSGAIALATADAYTTQGWRLQIELLARAIGAAGNLMGQGMWTSMNIAGAPATPPKGALSAMLPWAGAPAVGNNFDTTVAHIVDVFFTQTVNTAGSSLTCHQYRLISPN
jgi:hypothetical protein